MSTRTSFELRPLGPLVGGSRVDDGVVEVLYELLQEHLQPALLAHRLDGGDRCSVTSTMRFSFARVPQPCRVAGGSLQGHDEHARQHVS
jgi:hypothetical protein